MNESHNLRGNATESEPRSAEPTADLSGFFKFPSLSLLFQEPDRTALAEMRSRLSLTSQKLERVIRQGAQADADRAILISRSYSLTLTVLDELEQYVARQ